MGRRGVLSNMPKMVLPTVSWVALMSLLKKAPKNLSALGPGIGAEMAMKALSGCRAAPQTDSLRYADDYFGHLKGRRHGSAGKRTKPAAMLPSIMGGCSSRPHTDSFRVHHVVNQDALQLMLTFGDGDAADADSEQEAFFEAQELCYGIIRDGDRLLHDDIYADDSTQASSSMRTCSSSLSASASRSNITNSACIAWSRSSVDSEGFYSTATSASFGHASSSADQLLNVGPHVSCDSRPSSSSMASSWAAASELVYSNVNLDHYLKSDAGGEVEESEPQEEEHLVKHNEEMDADQCKLCAQDDQNNSHTLRIGTAEYGIHKVGHKSYEDDDEPVSYKGDADVEEEEELEIVAEMCYSENPLDDFAEAISRIVVQQQLNEAAQLQELYWRFLRLNAPRHHRTITLAFLHALQRLASVEPHFLRTLL